MIFTKRSAELKSAVIGVGYLGRFHAEKYFRSDATELVAVVDIEEKNAREVARKWKAHALTDYKALPALGVRCASVASTTSSHFEIAKWLLENGIDVLVEKPITTTIDQAVELEAIAQRHGRILQAGHLERFNPAFREMKKILSRPGFLEARRIAQFAGRGHDVDVVLDLMIHDIDIILHVVDRPIQAIDAIGVPVLTRSVDIANARINFEGGITANITASRAAFQTERTIRVFQHDRYISLDFGKKHLKVYTKSSEKTRFGVPDVKIQEYSLEQRDALQDEVDSFLEAVIARSTPEVSGRDGLRALEVATAISNQIAEKLPLLLAEHAEHELTQRIGNAGT